MKDNYQKLFNSLEDAPVPNGLKESVLLRIESEALKQRRIQMGFFVSASFASGFGTVFLFTLLLKSLSQSGLYEYLSLIFSDGGALVSFWKEFAFTFMESLPVLVLAGFLAATAVFLWAAAKLMRAIRPSFLITQS